MKKINLLILPLLALTMAGCTRNSSSTSQNSSETPITDKLPDSSSSASSSVADSSSLVSSSEISSAEESSSSSSSLDPYSVGWNRDVTDAMLKYLNGTVLPFTSLGTNKYVTAEYKVSYSDYGILTILGDKEWDSTSTSSSAETAYTAAGWTIETNSANAFKAKDPTGKISVSFEKVSYSDSTIVIKATYDEDYNLLDSTSAWDSELAKSITDTFSDSVPYVYLGTKNPTVSTSSSYTTSLTMTIYGGKWNSAVITDAKTTLTAAGYTIDTENSTSEKLIATGKATNGKDEFTITIDKSGYTAEKIEMVITKKEAYDPTGFTAWPQDVLDDFNSYLGGHILPVTYLGTKTPTTYYYQYSTELDIRGGGSATWNDSILTNAKTNWVAEGWTISEDLSTSTYSKSVTFTKEFSDNCKIKAKISQNTSYGPLIEAYFTEGIVVPESCTDWTTATQNLMNTNFNGVKIPYVYLNTTTETAVWDAATSTMTITGGDFKSPLLTMVNETYSSQLDSEGNAVWKTSLSTYSSTVTMKGTLNGSYFDITFKKNFNDEAEMTIIYTAPYSVPENATEWSQDVKDQFTQYMDGHQIPYVYLRTMNPTASYSSYNKDITIQGGVWDDKIIDEAKKAFTADNWEDIDVAEATASTSKTLTCSKDFGDGCSLSVRVDRYSIYSTNAQIVVTYSEGYDVAHAPTEWSATTKQAMSASNFGIELPYVYLGTKMDKGSYSTLSYGATTGVTGKLSISGSAWSDKIVSAGKTAFEADGWNTIESKNDYGKLLLAYKEVAETSGETTTKTFYSVVIKRNSSVGEPQLYAWRSNVKDYSETASWDETAKTRIQKYIHSTSYMLPNIDFGSKLTFVTDSTDYLQVKNDAPLSQNQAIKIYEALKADTSEGEWDLAIMDSSNDLKIIGTKKMADKSKIRIDLDTYSDYSRINIYYFAPFAPSEGVTDWTSATKKTMKNKFDGYIIPYFYMGSDNPSLTIYSTYIALRGDVWDDEIYENIRTALATDVDDEGQETWNVAFDYSSTYTIYFVATREFSNGKHMTLRVYQSNNKPVIEIYYR